MRGEQETNTWRSDVLTVRPKVEALPDTLKGRVAWDDASKTLSLLGLFTPADEAELAKICLSEADIKRIGRILLKDPVQIGMTVEAAGPTLEASVYIGAKDYDFLNKEKPELTALINFGLFSFLSRPLLWALKALHQLVHNYGLAIILLTVFLRILLYPVNQKQMVSMKKMQAVQPKVEAIKRKYKKAPKDMEERNKMNQEIMALYKAEGVNPAGVACPWWFNSRFYGLFIASCRPPSSSGMPRLSFGSRTFPPRILIMSRPSLWVWGCSSSKK